MSWECLCTRSSEKWPTITAEVNEIPRRSSFHKAHGFTLYRGMGTTISKTRSLFAGQLRHPGVYTQWNDMVTNYSTRSLSFPSDVLQALNGLRNTVERLNKSTYAHGLWLEDLANGLAWFIQKPGADPDDVDNAPTETKERGQNPASPPSWSWASRWGHEIGFFESAMSGGTGKHFECDGIEGGGGSTDIAGGATLILRGCLRSARAGKLLDDWKSYQGHAPMWTGTVCDAISGSAIGWIAYDEDPDVAKPWEITCFLCAEGTYYDDSPMSFLALVPTRERKDEYRRVGLVFLDEINVRGHINEWLGMRDTKASEYIRITLV